MRHSGVTLFAAVVMSVTIAGCATLSRGGKGSTTLIDGAVGLENFVPVGDAKWSAAEQSVQASSGGKDQSFLVTKGDYGDFVAHVEFWASADANSGVFIRCDNGTTITLAACYEVNIFDQRPDPTYGTGAIVDVAKVAEPRPMAGGRWNTMVITARGAHLTVMLNGRTTVDVEDTAHASGRIALQWGRGTIKFRQLRIRAL